MPVPTTWLVYTSDADGPARDLGAAAYAAPSPAARVAKNRRDRGDYGEEQAELFYLEGSRLMVALVTTGATFDFKPPTLLFEAPYALEGQPPSYDGAEQGGF